MKEKYDIVYLTNTPSFYKLNLCNKIAEEKALLLVFYGYGSEAVNIDLKECFKWNFDFFFINKGDSNKRNKLKTFISLIFLMKKIKCSRILFSGWISMEYNIYSFLSPKSKNAIICESSILDVSFKGIKGWFKKKVINRMSYALPSGEPHVDLFNLINFKGKIFKTGGVGIFNKLPKIIKNTHKPLRYLYVGRLIEVKNIDFIIEEFNKNGKPLTIVGSGLLENELKRKANSNISFLGFVPNKELGKVYQSHDVFILPSKYEPWGLVVEEAIYWGLPVIVSNKVGCALDIVKNNKTGCVFDLGNITSFEDAILSIENNYESYCSYVNNFDFELRDIKQVESYYKILNS